LHIGRCESPRRGQLAAGAVCVRWRFGRPLVRCRSTAPRVGLLVASCGLMKSALCLPRRRVPGGAVWSGAWLSAPEGASCRVEPARRGQLVPAWGLLRRIHCTEVRRVRRPLGSSLRMRGFALRLVSLWRQVASAKSGQDLAWFLPTLSARRAVEAGKPASPVCCAGCVFREIDISVVAAAWHPLARRPRPVGCQVFGSATTGESSGPCSVRSPAAQVLRQRSPGSRGGVGGTTDPLEVFVTSKIAPRRAFFSV
jgi:hypothetical protein